ncbi:hypothetical protein L596_019667 [Steinernema carpocapsae]|nr:hypothetical protein L596_019667 [Steinernema carpocapsae]
MAFCTLEVVGNKRSRGKPSSKMKGEGDPEEGEFREEPLEEEVFEPSPPPPQAYPAMADCFDTYTPPPVIRNVNNATSHCLLRKYGDAAMEMLVEEIQKHPTLYPLKAKPYRDSVAWGKVLEALQQVYPTITDREAWRSWYCFRYNYQRRSCSRKWIDRMSFVDLAGDQNSVRSRPGGPRIHKFSGSNAFLERLQNGPPPDREPQRVIKYEDDYGNLLGSANFDSINASYDGGYNNNGAMEFEPDIPTYSGENFNYSQDYEDEHMMMEPAMDPDEVVDQVAQFSTIIGAPALAPKPAPKIMRLYRTPPTARTPSTLPNTSGGTIRRIISRSSGVPTNGVGYRIIRSTSGGSFGVTSGTPLQTLTSVLGPQPGPSTGPRRLTVLKAGSTLFKPVPQSQIITLDADEDTKPEVKPFVRQIRQIVRPAEAPLPAQPAPPRHDYFRSNLKTIWTDIEKMENSKQHLNAFKTKVMGKLNEMFSEEK